MLVLGLLSASLSTSMAYVYRTPGLDAAMPRMQRTPASRLARMMVSAKDGQMPLERLEASPTLEPREVIGSMMAALHRSNWDSPTPFYGFEIAMRFLAPTHAAKLKNAKPSGFSRFMRQ